MTSYRVAIRRTQKQADAERSAVVAVETADRKQLQKLAKAKGIPANQSTEALREALS